MVVQADEVVPVAVERREHEYEQQRPVNEQIAVAFDLTAMLGINVNFVGVEGYRREAEEHGWGEYEGLCVRGCPIFQRRSGSWQVYVSLRKLTKQAREVIKEEDDYKV